MTFFNTNSIKPTDKEQGVTQAGQTEKKINDLENQVNDIDERLSQTETKVDSLDTVVNTERLTADEVHSQHDYTNELSVSGDASVSGTVNADKVTASEITATDKVKTKDIQVTNNLTVEGTGTFAQVSAENFDIETFNANELNATELSSDNADITNLASDSITADEANITTINSNIITSSNVEASEKIIAEDAELSGTLDANIIYSKNLRVSRKLNVLELIAETMQSGRLFIAPENMQLIPENGWIHFHNVNAGRFILYLTDFTDVTTNIHSLGNVLFSAVIDYTNNNNKGNVNITYVQPQQKAFEKVYIADDGELWLKRSPEYLNARRAVVFAETEKEIIVDTFAEYAQTFDVSTAKSVNLSSFDGGAEINSEKILKGNYTIDGNCHITGYLTPGQTITERSLFLGYSDLITGDSNGVLSAAGASISGNETVGGNLSVTGTSSLSGDVTAGNDLTVTNDLTVGNDASVTGDITASGKVEAANAEISGDVSANRGEFTGDVRAHGQLISDGDTVVHGDLYVEGTTTTTNQAQVTASGNYIVTRENNSTPLGNNEFSGLAVNNYDTGKMATITADKCGEWRVSDSATSTATSYTDVANFNNSWFEGLTDTPATVTNGIITNESAVDLSDVVFYNNGYYHKDGAVWYGQLSIVSGRFDLGSKITDAATITALEALPRYSLQYYNSLTVAVIDSSVNQPLLTRDEKANLNQNDILTWDSVANKAVNLTRPGLADNNKNLIAQVDSNGVNYTWGFPEKADKLTTSRKINNTEFDGSSNITTSSWGTSRNISISDSDGTNTGSAIAVDGSAAITLKLPATIKAALTGIALGANSTGILTCSTAAGTAAKTVSLTGFSLATGVHLLIKFSNANSAANPTLNINSTGAKVITIGSGSTSTTPASASSTSSAWNGIVENVVYDAYYDGTYWRLSKLGGNISGIKAHYFSTAGGYIVYTNGLIIQWGKGTTDSNHGCTFSNLFDISNSIIQGTMYYNNSPATTGVKIMSNTSIRVGMNTDSNVTVTFLAIGY